MYDAQASHPDGGTPYGGLFRRMSAASIDSTILGIPIFAVMSAQGVAMFPVLKEYLANPEQLADAMSAEVVQIAVITAALYFVYKTAFEASGMRGTIGKIAMGLRVTDLQGNRLSLPAAAFRSWPAWIPAAVTVLEAGSGTYGILTQIAAAVSGLACILVGATSRKQGLHDILAGALVIRAGARFSAPQAVI